MAAATIRLGKISSINYTAGKARVVYEDRDDSVTSELPFLALQYNIPKVDDLVVVACFSNGTVSGVILGPVYNSANTPHEGGAGIFRQEMSNNVNEAVMSYSEKKQTIILRAPKIEFEGYPVKPCCYGYWGNPEDGCQSFIGRISVGRAAE